MKSKENHHACFISIASRKVLSLSSIYLEHLSLFCIEILESAPQAWKIQQDLVLSGPLQSYLGLRVCPQSVCSFNKYCGLYTHVTGSVRCWVSMVIKTDKLIALHKGMFRWRRLAKTRASKESNKLLSERKLLGAR